MKISRRPVRAWRVAAVEALETRSLLSGSPAAYAPQPVVTLHPANVAALSVATVSPVNSQTGVARDSSIAADLNLPNAGLDPATVTTGTVYLYRTSDGAVVPAVVNTTGGDDAIILQPDGLLDANTSYTFVITSNVHDGTGAAITPFTSTFTTGTAGAPSGNGIAFEQVSLPNTQGVGFTCVRMGPDGRLWAGAEDGRIFVYGINADGTLGTPQVITSLQTAEGGPRLLTGFAFDPASTAANPILWVSHGYYAFNNVPDYTGAISRMSGGPGLPTVQDVVVHLPRSIHDHLNEQPAFGPDGALYWSQGAMNSMGAPDTAWGNRPEHLLSAAILRLDVTKVTPGVPLDALTSDEGGAYNPYAAGAPLTIYATGVRNAFNLLWTADGHLYAPTNGASAGGNTPAGGGAPALNHVQQVESDLLFDVKQNRYYGHPNPVRNQFVLDGGNVGASGDPAITFGAYPAGTQPDPAYGGYAYDFGLHRSPDGIIQYTGGAFGGALNGTLLVSEYSGGDDIVALTRDASGNIVSAQHGIPGFGGFQNPVNLAENPATGFIYVAELGAQRLTLLRPIPPHATISANKSLVAFNSIATGFSGSGPSGAQAVTITDTGTSTLSLNGISVVAAPGAAAADASEFQITNAGALPSSLTPGESATIDVNFTPARLGISSAYLQLASNDTSTPVLNVSLRGIGTSGYYAGNEPGLQTLLDLYQIPVNVGDPTPSDTFFDTPPSQPNDEIYAPRFTKAGPGPVTVSPLAAFAIGSPVAARVGYYAPATPNDRTELFHISGATPADEQTVNPALLGTTAFDPGSAAFGLYSQWPHFIDNGHERVSYSEDPLNTWDTNVMRKMRTYPLKNADGSVVPNAYVVAFEDYNLQYDSNDVVLVVRNVKPQSAAPSLAVQNPAGLPFSDRLIFNRVQVPNSTYGDIVHDTNTIQLENDGEQPLTVNSLTLSDPTDWTLVNPPATPFTLAPGQTANVTVQFVATTDPAHTDNQTNSTSPTNGLTPQQAGGVYNGTLTIGTNDPVNPSEPIQLAGYWQAESEHENEPGLQTITSLLAGYQTTVGPAGQPDLTQSGTPTYYGEEVASGLWQAADPSQPVSVRQLDAFHNEADTTQMPPQLTSATTYWYNAGSGSLNQLFKNTPDESQSLLPHINGTSNYAAATFSPAGAFGWNLDGEYSEDARNTTDIQTYGRTGHAIRFYPLRDRSGNLIPNTWLMAMDYENGPYDNSDFQDLTYVVTNMRPSYAPPTPADVFATPAADGGVSVQWAPVSYGSGVGYDVYRAASPAGPFVKMNPVPLSQHGYEDTMAPVGVTSYYRVYAVDTGNGTPSLPATSSAVAAAAASSGGAPAAPADVAATSDSPTSVTLTWSPSPGATLYTVERLGPGDTDFRQIAAGVAGNRFDDSTVATAKTYVYRVRAENASGLSDYSQTATVTTQGIPGPVVADFGTIARGHRHVRQRLWPAVPQEFYGFNLTASTRVTIRLSNLKDDADLQLLDATGKVLATSSHPRRHNESITLTLAPGTYYARAYLVGTKGTYYAFDLTAHKVFVPHLEPGEQGGVQRSADQRMVRQV